MNASSPDDTSMTATLDDARQRFLARVDDLRPRLHRFCARMCRSALDGEDVVQEALASAYDRLDTLEDESRLEAWLFRIAHHKCVDFLRRERRWRDDTQPYDDSHAPATLPDALADDDDGVAIDAALVALVGTLPPKERAAVLLKDVLDHSLGEVATIIDSTVGGVKAALHRGRTKLEAQRDVPVAQHARTTLDDGRRQLLDQYVACFNGRDWDALGRLIRVDARFELVGVRDGTMRDIGRNYFGNYAALPWTWRLAVGTIDREPVIVHWRLTNGAWQPLAAVRLTWEGDVVAGIRDYVHVDYLLREAVVD